jgi:hypothetical protein
LHAARDDLHHHTTRQEPTRSATHFTFNLEVDMAKTASWKRRGSPIGRKGPRKANPKYKRRTGEPWTATELKQLKSLARQNTPTGVLSLKLQRPLAAVRSKAQREGISLRPANRAPYSRRRAS